MSGRPCWWRVAGDREAPGTLALRKYSIAKKASSWPNNSGIVLQRDAGWNEGGYETVVLLLLPVGGIRAGILVAVGRDVPSRSPVMSARNTCRPDLHCRRLERVSDLIEVRHVVDLEFATSGDVRALDDIGRADAVTIAVAVTSKTE